MLSDVESTRRVTAALRGAQGKMGELVLEAGGAVECEAAGLLDIDIKQLASEAFGIAIDDHDFVL